MNQNKQNMITSGERERDGVEEQRFFYMLLDCLKNV